MAQNQQGNLSNYPRPRPIIVTVPGGGTALVPAFEDHERWQWLVNTGLTALQNPGTAALGNNKVNASTAQVNIGPNQNGQDFSNTGSAGEVDFHLPAAVPGSGPFNFFVDAPHTVKVICSGGATIQNGATVGVANGNIANATPGSTVTVKCMARNRWVCFAVGGTWTVT